MDKVEVRAVIKYFCKKGMSPKEIHDDFIKTLESPSYSKVKKLAAEFRRAWKIMNGLGILKRLLQMKTLNLCTVCSCVTRSLHVIARQIGISFGAVQFILTDILGMSKVSARWFPRMLT